MSEFDRMEPWVTNQRKRQLCSFFPRGLSAYTMADSPVFNPTPLSRPNSTPVSSMLYLMMNFSFFELVHN